jgi:hypothetical protein
MRAMGFRPELLGAEAWWFGEARDVWVKIKR